MRTTTVSSTLQISRAKPNPIGKDKSSGGIPKPQQLLGEWVDIKNIGTESIRFSSMQLSHTLYTSRCEETGRCETYWSAGGSDSLAPGRQIRIYTGRAADKGIMNHQDNPPDWEGFANRSNFVLNNSCGDIIKVTWSDFSGNRWSDTAAYRPNPPEGVILTRVGNMLVPT